MIPARWVDWGRAVAPRARVRKGGQGEVTLRKTVPVAALDAAWYRKEGFRSIGGSYLVASRLDGSVCYRKAIEIYRGPRSSGG